MLKKRIVGVITVKGGRAVQSFGYRRYLPLGRPEWLAENLDRWGADEILVLEIDRRRRGLAPDIGLLRSLGRLGLSTPLAYGGGIRDEVDAVAVIQAGADRVCLDALMREDVTAVHRIAAVLGAQALIGVLPLSRAENRLRWQNYLDGVESPLPSRVLDLLAGGVVSEALVVDWRNEGGQGTFDAGLLDAFPLRGVPLIAFGGVGEAQAVELLARPHVIAVAMGNALSYREHAIQRLREAISHPMVRKPEYA